MLFESIFLWFNIYYNFFFCDNWIYTGFIPNTTGNWKQVIVWACLPNILNRKSPFGTHRSCSPIKVQCSIFVRMIPLMSIPHPTCRLFVLPNAKGEQTNKNIFVLFCFLFYSYLFIWKDPGVVKKIGVLSLEILFLYFNLIFLGWFHSYSILWSNIFMLQTAFKLTKICISHQ